MTGIAQFRALGIEWEITWGRDEDYEQCLANGEVFDFDDVQKVYVKNRNGEYIPYMEYIFECASDAYESQDVKDRM